MKFSTAALIKVCNDEITAREAAAEKAVTDAEKKYDAEKAEWLAGEHPQEIAKACRAILDKIRKGRIVTTDDFGTFGVGYRSANHGFNPTKPDRRTPSRKANIEKVTALRDFLMAVNEDEVTSSGLRDIGFRNIAAIIKTAAETR